MRVSELEVRMAPADVRQLLQSLLGPESGVTVESVAVDDARLRVRLRTPPLPAPVEVQAQINRVEPEALVLGLDIAAMAFLPATWRQKALDMLGQRLAAPGVSLVDGQLRIAAAALAAPIATSCHLGRAELRDGRLHLRFEDVQLRNPVEERAAGSGGGVGTMGLPEAPAGVVPAFEEGEPMAGDRDDGLQQERFGETGKAPVPGEPAAGSPADSAMVGAVMGAVPAAEAPGAGAGTGATAGGAEDGGAELPPERPVDGEHEATYRRMRERVASFLDRSLPDWLQPAVPWVLLLPDFIVLLARLVADPAVSTRAKLVAGGALAYLALPTDLLPDFIPGIGVLDDVALAVFALEALVGMSPPEVVQRHWPGEEDVLDVVRRGLEWTAHFFPRRFTDRLRGWLNEKQKDGPQRP